MRRRGPIMALACSMTLLALTSTQAQQVRRPATFERTAEVIDGALSLSRTIELNGISMAEVLGVARSIGPASSNRTATAVAAASISLGVWTPGRMGEPPGFAEASVIRRSVQDAWQMRIGSAQRRAQHFDIAYQLRGANGRPGCLSHGADASSEIEVRLEPIAPSVLYVEGDEDVLQGGVTFYLDLASVRRAGQYQGTLTVTFNNF